MKIWEAVIKMASGPQRQIKTQIPAENVYAAIALLEQQYGKGCCLGPPREIKYK
jgi:hypothetical protein